MLRSRTLWPTRRRFQWPQRPRFRWPVTPSNILIAPTYPTLTLPTDCGCCGTPNTCCPGQDYPETIYITITFPDNNCPNGVITGSVALTLDPASLAGHIPEWKASATSDAGVPVSISVIANTSCQIGITIRYGAGGTCLNSQSNIPRNVTGGVWCSPFYFHGLDRIGDSASGNTDCPCLVFDGANMEYDVTF